MALTLPGLSAAAAGIANAAAYASLHTADPGTTGAGELTGGNPAYRRKPCSWGTPVDGVAALSQPVLFDVPASVVSHFGYWSAAVGGSFLGGERLRDTNGAVATETFSSQGVYQLTTATLTITAT